MAKINQYIVKRIEDTTHCPILEMFYTEEDNTWYVCFEEYTCIKGQEQLVHLDDVLKAIEVYDNIEYLTNETYEGDDYDTWFEQITFQWKDEREDIKATALKDYEEICICDGKKQGAWCGDAYEDEVVTDIYEEHMFNVAERYGIEIPPMEDFNEWENLEYMNREARATEVFWTLQKVLRDIILG